MRARNGFTLVEVLVTLVLIGLLIGVVLPAVINQLGRGEPTRIAEDLESVRSATRIFRVDVKRWPATLEQLVDDPGAGAVDWDSAGDLNAATIPDVLVARWNGPYLEEGGIEAVTDYLPTAVGGLIDPVFVKHVWGSNTFLAIRVIGLDTATIQSVSDLIDGEIDLVDGRVQALENVAEDTTFMLYLASPIN